jgi:hypothetical protein
MIINAKYTKKNETERYFFNAVDFFIKKKRLTEPVNLFYVIRYPFKRFP